ncbi:MAG: alpha/beta hydrolase [Deltaproteobacteria bacterium]|nr:alpha/beta hydrolase [Deltaproteobacteria bacterium]
MASISDDADALFVYAHGAGAPMNHAFMESSARELAERGIATLRFNFVYSEAGKKRPDRQPAAVAAIRAAVAHARTLTELPIYAGGKSFGGRMSTHAQLAELGVQGLILVGFPLHAPGKAGTKRAEHLSDVGLPMLFLQGTRDSLADLELMREVCHRLPAATLHVVDGADHGFHVLKRSGRTDQQVLVELADTIRAWVMDSH